MEYPDPTRKYYVRTWHLYQINKNYENTAIMFISRTIALTFINKCKPQELCLQEYNFEVIHSKDTDNIVADTLIKCKGAEKEVPDLIIAVIKHTVDPGINKRC